MGWGGEGGEGRGMRCMNKKFTITLFSVCIILLLCLPKNIDFLKYPGE